MGRLALDTDRTDGLVIQAGRLYVRLLVGTAVGGSLLLGIALVLLFSGVVLKSSVLLTLFPLFGMAAVAGAIGVLAPVIAVLRLMPVAVGRVGSGALRAMGAAAILGLAGGVLTLIRPLVEHPDLLLLMVGLALVALMAAWVAGSRIVEPIARWAGRWATGVLVVLSIALVFLGVVPRSRRDELVERAKARLSRALQSPPERIPYWSLAGYRKLRKFSQVDRQLAVRVWFCRQADRDGPDQYVLANRPGMDLFDGCAYQPLTIEASREIERYLEQWEKRQEQRRQRPAPMTDTLVAPEPLPESSPKPELPTVPAVEVRDVAAREVLPGDTGTNGLTELLAKALKPAVESVLARSIQPVERALPENSPGASPSTPTYAEIPPRQLLVSPKSLSPGSVLIPKDSVLRLELTTGLEVRKAKPGTLLGLRCARALTVDGEIVLPRGIQARALVTRMAREGEVCLVHVALTALQLDDRTWLEARDAFGRAIVTVKVAPGLRTAAVSGSAGVGTLAGAVPGGRSGAPIGGAVGGAAGAAASAWRCYVRIRKGTELAFQMNTHLELPKNRQNRRTR